MSWKAELVLLIMGYTLLNYYCGLYYANESNKHKKLVLNLSMIINVGLLVVFKYLGFFSETAHDLGILLGISYAIPIIKVVLPVGISFYTFQTMGYNLDVYYNRISPERHLGRFALYVSFFPQLVAGPIERAGNLLIQFKIKPKVTYENFSHGLAIFFWGLFKKVVIADRLAIFVDAVYGTPASFQGEVMLIAVFFFSIQLFCDFSGYSDMAIGMSYMMGFSLMQNFDLPYKSQSITEFWRRWHISLSSWFQDYIFNPLAIYFRDHGKAGVMLGIFITFFLSGLWHGANWNYVVFGVLHGVILIYEFRTRKARKKLTKKWNKLMVAYTSIFLTFLYATFTFIFFRSSSLGEAWVVIEQCFSGYSVHPSGIYEAIKSVGMNKLDFLVALGSLVFLAFVTLLRRNEQYLQFMHDYPVGAKWAIKLVILFGIIIFGVDGGDQFIYFQF
ncbi:MAG: MBOAT family O-acyltransferase [Cytophagales bacterium]|nr:MBOAT family O-acyltransferase [Cytophagales bacterium]